MNFIHVSAFILFDVNSFLYVKRKNCQEQLYFHLMFLMRMQNFRSRLKDTKYEKKN